MRSKEIQNRIHSSDGLALSAVGPGTLPLYLTPAVGNFDTGTPLATGFFPMTGVGEPRVDGYTMAGIDLLFRWDFKNASLTRSRGCGSPRALRDAPRPGDEPSTLELLGPGARRLRRRDRLRARSSAC